MKGTSHQYNTEDPDELLGEFYQAFKEEEQYNFIPMFLKTKGEIFQLILLRQHYPETKIRQRHYSKRKL